MKNYNFLKPSNKLEIIIDEKSYYCTIYYVEDDIVTVIADENIELPEQNIDINIYAEDGVYNAMSRIVSGSELNGQYFTAHVSAGDPIRRGQLLLEFDLDKIAEKYKTVTPVLVVNTDEYASVSGISGIKADNDTPVIKINA